MWSTVPLARYFTNSLIVSSIASTLSVLVALITGYVLSRFAFKGRGAFTSTILGTQMIPGILFLLPLFLIFVNIDRVLGFDLLYQTRFGLIIVFMTFTLPFSIYMFTNYLNGIPQGTRRGRQGRRMQHPGHPVQGHRADRDPGHRRGLGVLLHARLG